MARTTVGPTQHGVMGRWAIFRDKTHGIRVQAMLPLFAAEDFKMHRLALTLLYRDVMKGAPPTVSAADTFIYLVIGEAKTRRYLTALARSAQP